MLKDEDAMKDGELVVRFFGMKDDDSSLHIAMKVIQGAAFLFHGCGLSGRAEDLS